MALLNVGEVVTAVAALFDDPSQSEYDIDYVLPLLNLRWSNLVINLVMLGLQYSEEQAVIQVPQGTSTLAAFMAADQPLGSLMKPKSLDWKLSGAPDTQYSPATSVSEVDDVDPASQGLLQYSWQGGTLLVTPSAVDMDVRVRFQAMSTQLVDPTDDMIRGATDLIAYRTAELIAAVRGMPVLQKNMKEFGDTALDDFAQMSVMGLQSQPNYIPATHRRGFRGCFVARASANP